MFKHLLLASFLPVLTAARNCSAPAYTNEAVGWQSGGCYRGTWTIISSCLATIVACTWTIQHLNIPARTDGAWVTFRRKFKWMVITVLFPEVILVHAGFQFRMAWRALKAIEESHRPVQWPWYKRLWKSLRRRIVGKSKDADEERGKEPLKAPDHSNKWTMTHCYYANMGGFVYIKGGKKVRLTADEPAAPPFVQQHRPEIFKEDIQDKSKQDWLAKTWAGFQILQLILSVVTRSIQHVRFSQLEMVTLSFAVCGVLIYITNIHKPQNVGRDTQIKTEIASSKGSKDSFSITPTHDSLWAILRNKRNHDVDNNNSEQYAPRIPNDSIPFNESNHIVHPVVYLLAGSSALFGLIHAIAWSFEFPTPQEKLLWRIATGISAVSPVLGLLAIPIVQLTRSAGDPELFVGKCLRLLQQYRWHHPGQYHVSESIANLEEVLKGLLLSDEIPKLQYSQILMIESVGIGPFLLDLENFLLLRGPYKELYKRPQNQRAGDNGEPHASSTIRLDLHDDKQFTGDFIGLVEAFRSPDAKKLRDEARTDQWPRKTIFPAISNRLILYGTSIMYCISRFVLLGIAFSSIRKMPGTVYVETDWTGHLPFFGAKG